jgi:hypothetical protein
VRFVSRAALLKAQSRQHFLLRIFSMNELTTAHRLLNLVDLTSLNDGDMEIDIARLCEQAVTDFGKVAAVCVWPQFVPLCRKWLADTGIRVATGAGLGNYGGLPGCLP